MKNYYIPSETMAAFKEREFTVCKFTSKGRFYLCYSKVMQYLLSDSPVLINRETNQPESVERGEVLDIYAVAYDNGRDIFKNDIKPDASIEYLVEQYNEHYNGWKTTSEAISLLLTQSQVEKMGQAAGIRYEFEIYKQKKRSEFEPLATKSQSTEQLKTTRKPPVELSMKYMVEQWRAEAREVEIRTRVEKELRKSGIAPEPANTQTGTKEPREFTGKKLIDIYDPEKVHKEFKKELKCDYDTFKAWFVDSVICDEKMKWTYKDGNKQQLRSFIYTLTYGWKPAETNAAFKITVNSNDRENKLNPDLLQRLEKCKVD